MLRSTPRHSFNSDTSSQTRRPGPDGYGRKNWLFAGSDAGGERAAAFYALIETCKLNGIDPEAYLRSILANIADHPINRVAELLPWNWAEANQLPAPRRLPLGYLHNAGKARAERLCQELQWQDA